MTDKYSMTQEENVFWAKRNMIDYIWKDATLEGIAVTYADTEAIYYNMEMSKFKPNDIQAVLNLKHAWQFILDVLDYDTNYALICEVHRYVSNNLVYRPGQIRSFPVTMGGTKWTPAMPMETVVKETIAEIKELSHSSTERALKTMLYMMRAQIFEDGNKRAAMMVANHILIKNGRGIIAVPEEHQAEFRKLLVQYYETNEWDAILQFLYHNCLDGKSQNVVEQSEAERPKEFLEIAKRILGE